jgi:hypothetical protein
LGGEPEVMEEARRIGISGFDFVPQSSQSEGRRVAGGERCFPRAGWRADPHDRSRSGVQAIEQPLARMNSRDVRPGQLRKPSRHTGTNPQRDGNEGVWNRVFSSIDGQRAIRFCGPNKGCLSLSDDPWIAAVRAAVVPVRGPCRSSVAAP